MAGLQMLRLTTLLLFSSWVAWSNAITLPSARLYGTGQRICNYQYAIPNGANCVTYGPSLEQHLDAVQQDMDRIKLQYVSQNTVLQEELRKLRQQASTNTANFNDLTKDLKTLQNTVFSLQAKITQNNNNNNNNYGGNNNNNNYISNNNAAAIAMLQQLVTTTRTQLTQNLLQLQNQMNSALSSVHSDLQRDSVQQSKIDSAFQSQLRQQQQDLTTVFQKLQQLQNQVSLLNRTTSPILPPVLTTPPPRTTPTPAPTTPAPQVTTRTPGPVTPSPQLLQLQSDLRRLDSRVAAVEKEVAQADLPKLQADVVDLQTVAKNHTDQLDSLTQEVQFVDTNLIPDIQTNMKTSYDALTQLTATVNGMKPLEQKVQDAETKVASLKAQTNRLAADIMDQKTMVVPTLKTDIKDLETQVNFVAKRLSDLIRVQHFTTPVPPTTPTPTFKIPTPRPAGGGKPSQSFVGPAQG